MSRVTLGWWNCVCMILMEITRVSWWLSNLWKERMRAATWGERSTPSETSSMKISSNTKASVMKKASRKHIFTRKSLFSVYTQYSHLYLIFMAYTFMNNEWIIYEWIIYLSYKRSYSPVIYTLTVLFIACGECVSLRRSEHQAHYGVFACWQSERIPAP